MRIWSNTIWIYAVFEKVNEKGWASGFLVCAPDRVNFLIRFYPRFPHFVVVRFSRPTRDSLPIETNIEHNTSFPAHSGFRLCVDLLVYFVPFVRDANNRFCSNSIICSFAFSSSSHCITVLCSLFARIEYFFLIWSRMEMSIVRQQPVWLFAIFDFFFFSRISTQIFAFHMWTWLSSEALAQMAAGLYGLGAEWLLNHSDAAERYSVIRLKFSEKRTKNENLLSHAHDARGEVETMRAWFVRDFRISTSSILFCRFIRWMMSTKKNLEYWWKTYVREENCCRSSDERIGELAEKNPTQGKSMKIGIVWIINFFASSQFRFDFFRKIRFFQSIFVLHQKVRMNLNLSENLHFLFRAEQELRRSTSQLPNCPWKKWFRNANTFDMSGNFCAFRPINNT